MTEFVLFCTLQGNPKFKFHFTFFKFFQLVLTLFHNAQFPHFLTKDTPTFSYTGYYIIWLELSG